MIDFDKLVAFISQTIDRILNKAQDGAFSSVDGQIVEYSLNILFSSLLYAEEQADKFIGNKHKV